jgi:acetyl-CoA carboxylase biotin carboxylase subunit
MHQKLIEESPSPALCAADRDSLGALVAHAVTALGYRSAGTVEFLRDREGQFFFMEMNTRLQVEHPVTEMVSGVDLVVAQLRIAARQPLDRKQDELRLAGHAIEFRINAEDPQHDFRPDPGTIESLELPPAELPGVRVRWDSAIRPGYRIPPHYDSMIGKLIVHGTDREAALRGADLALSQLRIGGVHTTIEFHRRVLASPAFVAGSYDLQQPIAQIVGG